MSIASSPSKLSLPQVNPGVSTVLQYLSIQFPHIDSEQWKQRMLDGKVHWHDGTLITPDTPFRAQQRVYYYRELASELVIPFAEKILYQDEHLLVAYKPHFLPVTVGGAYIKECLQNRLREKTQNPRLQALHRLDRATAGLVMFSVDPKTSALYHHLFETRQMQKTYHAIANVGAGMNVVDRKWDVKNRLLKSKTSITMQIEPGQPNSHSLIKGLQQVGQQALFELKPVTGKTHQLRVHMLSLGWPILNDGYYPERQTKPVDNYAEPLQLLATELQFIDPITHRQRSFQSEVKLVLDPKH